MTGACFAGAEGPVVLEVLRDLWGEAPAAVPCRTAAPGL